MNRRAVSAAGAVLAVLLLLVVWLQSRPAENVAPAPSAPAKASSGAWALRVCPDLDKNVDAAVAAIRANGPYLRPRNDGGTFGNREGLLPPKPSGYYREYTVAAPSGQFPGPRRLITGGQARLGDEPKAWFYTADHYASFCEFSPAG